MAMDGVRRSGGPAPAPKVEDAKPLVPGKAAKTVSTVAPDAHEAPAQAKKLSLEGASATQAPQPGTTTRLANDWLGAAPAAPLQDTLRGFIDAKSPRVALYQESIRRSPSLEALAKSRYGDEVGLAALSRLEALGKPFGELVADPGVVMRLDDFIAFAGTQDLAKLKPWDLREAYSEKLGVAHMIRGLALTKPQADEMKSNGMTAGYLRADFNGNTTWSKGDPFSQNFFSMMKERIHGGGWGPISAAPEQEPLDGLMSVTPHRNIAMLVTGDFVKQLNGLGRNDIKVYIFKLDVPQLDLLPGPVFEAFPGRVNDDELFAPFMFRKDEITSMEGPLEPQIIDLSTRD